MSSLREDEDNTGVPNPVLHEYLSAAAVEPLRLDRFHYGSDAVTDVLGIAKVLETLVSLVEKWVNRKYDKELRQRDLELKDEEILDRRAERHAKETQNFLNLLSALKSPGLQLSREDLMLLLRTSESPWCRLRRPRTHRSAIFSCSMRYYQGMRRMTRTR